VWALNESKRAGVAEAQKAMKRFGCSMHPVERAELSANHFGEELDLRLNVLGVDREMIKAVGYAHGETLLVESKYSAFFPQTQKSNAICGSNTT
jgi:hypothetical protein